MKIHYISTYDSYCQAGDTFKVCTKDPVSTDTVLKAVAIKEIKENYEIFSQYPTRIEITKMKESQPVKALKNGIKVAEDEYTRIVLYYSFYSEHGKESFHIVIMDYYFNEWRIDKELKDAESFELNEKSFNEYLGKLKEGNKKDNSR